MKYWLRIITGILLIIFGVVITYLFIFRSEPGDSLTKGKTGKINQLKKFGNSKFPPRNRKKKPRRTSRAFFNCVHFFNREEGIVMGSKNGRGVIATTSNGGKDWQTNFQERVFEIHDVSFPERNLGYAFGNIGSGKMLYFLKTTNGGKKWELKSSPLLKKKNIYSVYFIDKYNGWISGQHGSIASTEDGGKTWKEQQSGMDGNLRSIFFIDKKYGWCVGDNGTILITYNGGEKWSRQPSGVTRTLNDIKMLDKNYGVIVGLANTFLHTNNGGKNWDLINSPMDRHLRGVFLLDKDHCWVVGHRGGTIKISGNFSEFTPVYIENEANLLSVFFIDKNHGWATGEFGTILYTSNGGNKWIIQESEF